MVSARSAAQRLDQAGHPCHLVWNPLYGEIIQLIPIVRAARSLYTPEFAQPLSRPPRYDFAEVNTEGRLCVQICVVAFSHEPFTRGPLKGLSEIMTWLDSWGIPRSWPAGRPASFPDCHNATRSRRLWARGGHFGESQVPSLTAVGPGAIDVERLTGRSVGRSSAAAVTSDRLGVSGALSSNDGAPVTGPGQRQAEEPTGRDGYGSGEIPEYLGGQLMDSALSRTH
jgi:hypothetical protein